MPSSEHYYANYLGQLVTDETRWLDLGCGRELIREWIPNARTLQSIFKSRCAQLYGIDAVAEDVLNNPFLHRGFVGDIRSLPFPNESFNLLTAHMVVEHVDDPRKFLQECHRVLMPGGRLLIITPNLRHYIIFVASLIPPTLRRWSARLIDGRVEHDIFTTHYRLNTISEIRRYAIKCGFFIDVLGAVDTHLAFRGLPVLRNIEDVLNGLAPGIDLIACLRKP